MIEKNGSVIPQVSVRCIADHFRESDGKQIAKATTVGWVDTKEWGKDQEDVSVLWNGGKRRVTLPKSILETYRYAVWNPVEKEYVDEDGEVLTYPNAFEAEQEWEGTGLIVAEYISGNWGPPQPPA